VPSSLSRVEFAELAAAAVEAVGVESANGRVHVVPGERMLRYYTTQGVMDRPQLAVTASGKEARYGRRHLLQFVAAKRLQAGGASLPVIRLRLAEASGTELAELAAIPPEVIPPDLGDVEGSVASAAPPPFWRQGPAAPAPVAGAGDVTTSSVVAARATFPSAVAPVPGRTVTVITLGPGIEVHLDNAIHPPAQAAVLAAALAGAVPTTLPASREEP